MQDDTVIVHAGRDPHANHGIVNPPVYHASTVLHKTVADLEESQRNPMQGVRYGRRGTPTTFALEEAVAALEGGYRTVAVGSGLAAIATTLLAFLKAGDHVLVTDSVYAPCRRLCNERLASFGVETTYYDPLIGAGIGALMRPNTRLVYLESPGSQTFEVQDVPAIAAAAHAGGAVAVMDNTWASPLLFKPFAHGIDVSIQAGTKYVVGHSDAMMGLVTTTEAVHEQVRRTAFEYGQCAGPDDCYLAQRGLRTLSVRLDRHAATAMRLATWLQARPEVERVLYPALPGDPGHSIWKRDFSGASGLFGVVLKPVPKAAVDAMLDGMHYFGMGFSWGGYESLLVPTNPARYRTATVWEAAGPMLRVHAGLEDPDDLLSDLSAGFDRLNARR